MDLIKKKESICPSVSEFDLFLGGDVQVLESGIEQQVLVDLVSGDFDRRSAVHLGMGRQVQLQHLHKHNNCINTLLNKRQKRETVQLLNFFYIYYYCKLYSF